MVGAALPINAVMFCRNVIDKVGAFDEQMLVLEDFDYLLRIEHAVPLALSPAVTLDVRVRVELNNVLGAYLSSYVAFLDMLYAKHPVVGTVERKRAAHRVAVQKAIDDVVGKEVGVNDIARLLATLAGRFA